MRLHELSMPETRQDAADVLIAAGYRELGTGGFAGVYTKDGARKSLTRAVYRSSQARS